MEAQCTWTRNSISKRRFWEVKKLKTRPATLRKPIGVSTTVKTGSHRYGLSSKIYYRNLNTPINPFSVHINFAFLPDFFFVACEIFAIISEKESLPEDGWNRIDTHCTILQSMVPTLRARVWMSALSLQQMEVDTALWVMLSMKLRHWWCHCNQKEGAKTLPPRNRLHRFAVAFRGGNCSHRRAALRCRSRYITFPAGISSNDFFPFGLICQLLINNHEFLWLI